MSDTTSDRECPPPNWRTHQSQNLHRPWVCEEVGRCTFSHDTEAAAIAAAWDIYDRPREPLPPTLCEAVLRTLLAGNGWIVSHDAPTGRSTIVFGAIPDDALGDTSVGDALAHAHGLLFPPEDPTDA